MDIRNQLPNHPSSRGSVSLQLLVFMVPVFFGFMGFAVDLGRLYLIRGELNQAASAMALAAAGQLNGTGTATDFATNAAMLTLNNANLNANKYNFGALVLNESGALLTSTAAAPNYFATAGDALAADPSSAGGGSTAGSSAQYAQAYITADAPLLFWSVLPLGQSRKTTIAAAAVAGMSAPLCTACQILPVAIPAIDATDAVNFGYTVATRYTLGYVCNGPATPAALAGDTQRVNYLLINRYDTASTLDETQQLFRDGAQGLSPSADATQACVSVNGTETIWASATTSACLATTPNRSVQEMLCGLTTRLDLNTPAVCAGVTGLADLESAFAADTDTAAYDDYTAYTGSNRRVITVAVVDALNAAGGMTVLGFRQFLLEPTSGDTMNDPADRDGRFSALYIGSPVPLKQGRFDGSCGISAGPGKVVLFQ